MDNGAVPAQRGDMRHQCTCIVAVRRPFESMKEYDERLVRFPVDEIEIDEILVGRIPALTSIGDERFGQAFCRVNRLQMSAGQPPWRTVVACVGSRGRESGGRADGIHRWRTSAMPSVQYGGRAFDFRLAGGDRRVMDGDAPADRGLDVDVGGDDVNIALLAFRRADRFDQIVHGAHHVL